MTPGALVADANVNAKDSFGWTHLHQAARWGQKNVIELLISKSEYVNAQMDDGGTPLD
ncbi:ankyrin repeat domain-containing protein [bacterium]|nr:ankyrin repeat domain-containing protein [bacterium]